MWIYYIKIYFDYLIELNNNFIQLVGLDGKENSNCRERKYFDIFDGLSKLIPMSADYNEKSINITKKDKKSGILELLSNELDFIIIDYMNLVANYNFELYNIKMLRNKLEHTPHCILSSTNVTNGQYSSINLNYKTYGISYKDINIKNIESYYCNVEILLNIISDLNTIFSKIQHKIDNILSTNKEIDSKSNYFKKCLEIDFIYYNDIYKNQDFLKICKIVSKINLGLNYDK